MAPEILHKGKWLTLASTAHRDANGVEKSWEYATRTGNTLAVAVVARLRDPDRIVLVKQWRPPMQAYTLEFPAGLVESGDSAADTALRELSEETGFVGKITRIGPAVCSSPGMTDETIVWVEADIVGQEVPHPEVDEAIEVVLVPSENLRAHIEKFARDGVRIEGKLYGYVCGRDFCA